VVPDEGIIWMGSFPGLMASVRLRLPFAIALMLLTVQMVPTARKLLSPK
jgi:hypothetical protein